MTGEQNSLPQLPKNWVWTRLGDIGTVAAGGTPSTDDSENFNGNIAWVTPADLSDFDGKFINRGRRNLSEKGLNSSSAVLLPTGTVLFSSRAPIGYVAIAANSISTNQGFKNLTCHEGIFNEYVFYYLKASKNLVESYGSGTTFLEVSASRFVKIPLPLAPFPEQRRIVAKIEELFTNLDAGVESLKKVKTQLKRYRQAVLKYAIEGKLTEEWRKTHKDQIEPAQKLLERIKQERKKKIKVRYEEPSAVDTSSLPELPEGWVWTKSGNLSWFVTSGSRDWKKYYSSSGPFFIRTENINTNKLSLDNVAHVSLPEKVEGKRSLVEKNDILIIITGANVGKVALVNQEIGEAYVSQSVALMKLVMSELARFVHFAMIADGFGKTELSRMVYGMGRPVLSLKNVQEITLPLAPLLEQEKIVEEIECRLSVADEIEKTIEQGLKQSELLRQSILKRAFEGRLVPQDPTDESADKLLARIKEERMRREVATSKKKNQLKQLELVRYIK